jgi:hypothetical protein
MLNQPWSQLAWLYCICIELKVFRLLPRLRSRPTRTRSRCLDRRTGSRGRQAVGIEVQDIAIKEEMDILSLVVQHHLYTWIDTFPLPDNHSAIFPQDFLNEGSVTIRKVVKDSLGSFEVEDAEQGDYWTREMEIADLEKLIA